MNERFLLTFVSLDLWRAEPWFRFAVNHASHVSFLSFRLTTILPKFVLMEPPALPFGTCKS